MSIIINKKGVGELTGLELFEEYKELGIEIRELSKEIENLYVERAKLIARRIENEREGNRRYLEGIESDTGDVS